MNKTFTSILSTFVIFTTSNTMAQENHQHHQNNASAETLTKKFEGPERDKKQQPERVLDYIGDIKDKTVMDLGSGTGYFSVKLANRGAKVIAADVDDNFQNYLRTKIEQEHVKNIQLKKVPYDSPALEKQEVDIVFVANTYHHMENRTAYFSKVKDGLKPNGILIILDYFKTETPDGPPMQMRVSIDEVVAELKAAGFTSFEATIDLLPHQYIIKAK